MLSSSSPGLLPPSPESLLEHRHISAVRIECAILVQTSKLAPTLGPSSQCSRRQSQSSIGGWMGCRKHPGRVHSTMLARSHQRARLPSGLGSDKSIRIPIRLGRLRQVESEDEQQGCHFQLLSKVRVQCPVLPWKEVS